MGLLESILFAILFLTNAWLLYINDIQLRLNSEFIKIFNVLAKPPEEEKKEEKTEKNK